MDVSRLPIIAHGPGLPAPPADAAQRNRGVDPVAEAAAARRRPRDAAEQVIQGELLQRNRGEQHYNSTSDYLRSRRFEGGDAAGSGFSGSSANPAGRQAVGAYLSHTRELIQPDLNRGTAVDYFI